MVYHELIMKCFPPQVTPLGLCVANRFQPREKPVSRDPMLSQMAGMDRHALFLTPTQRNQANRVQTGDPLFSLGSTTLRRGIHFNRVSSLHLIGFRAA